MIGDQEIVPRETVRFKDIEVDLEYVPGEYFYWQSRGFDACFGGGVPATSCDRSEITGHIIPTIARSVARCRHEWDDRDRLRLQCALLAAIARFTGPIQRDLFGAVV